MLPISDRVKKIDVSERSQRKTVIPPGAARMDKGEPDFPTPLHIQEAAFKAMHDNFTHYGNAAGDPELRDAITFDIHRDYGVERKPNEVLVTNGGIEAINVMAGAFLNPGDEVLILDPEYSAYADAVLLFGGVPVSVPLGKDFSVDLDAVKQKITKRTKMMMFSNPCNPTGRVMRLDELRGLADLALKHDFLLIADEVYNKLIYEDHKHVSLMQLEEIRDRAVLINSFSKTYAMTGWRVGYIVSDNDIVSKALKFHKSLLTCISTPSQKACVAALLGPQDCVEEMRLEYAKRRQVMHKHLSTIDGLGSLHAEGAFYFLPRYQHDILTRDLVSYMYDRGVLIRSGTEFGSNGEGYFRIAYAATPVADLESGMVRLKEAFDSL